MADILKIRRSLVSGNVPAPASLGEGELAANIPDKKLWIGDSNGDPIEFPLGSIGDLYLDDLLDVDAPAPEGGDRLAWDGDEEKWIPKRSLSALGIMEFEYTMQLPPDSTPSLKQISRNDSDPAQATILYLNKRDRSGADISLFIKEMRAGDWLNLHKKIDVDVYEKYDIIGTPTQNGDIWEIPVENYENAGTLNNGNRVRLLWRVQGQDTDNYREPMGSGLHHGGQLNTGTNNLEIEVSAGRGIIVDATTNPFKIQREDILWNDQTITITPTSPDTQEIHVIYVDINGDILSAPIQDIQYKLIYDYIRLGWAELSQNMIINIVDAPFIVGQTAASLADFYYAVKDGSKSRGLRLQPCNTGLQLYCEEGEIFSAGINWYNDKKRQNILHINQTGDANNPITFQLFDRNAIPVLSPTTELPKYVDNNGVIEPLTGGEAAIHYIFFSSAGFSLQLGQVKYENFASAFKNACIDKNEFIFAPGSNVSGTSTLIGQIIISKNAVDFSNKAFASIISSINDETGNIISPVDLTLVPQYLLQSIAGEDITQGNELSMDINGNIQNYPATGGEGQSQFTSDNVILHSAIFLNLSNNQGVIAWVKDGESKIYVVTAQGNPNGSISYSPVGDITTPTIPNALRICKIDNTRAGMIFSYPNSVSLGVIQNNGLSSAPSIGTTRSLNNVQANDLGVDCVWDYDNDNLIGVYSLTSNNTVYNRYCEISGNNVDAPPESQEEMVDGIQVRCTTEGNNVIVTAVNNGVSNWREAGWKKNQGYNQKTDVETLSDCSNHCGLQAFNGTIYSQFENNGSIRIYSAKYSSTNEIDPPLAHSIGFSGKWGDILKTDSGIIYSFILDNTKVKIFEGTIMGGYDLVYTSIFEVDETNTEIQSLIFGSVFAMGIGYNSNDANKVFLIDSAITRTDHFIGVAPNDTLQGQQISVDIALPLMTLPREYPPGTYYNFGPYKYQVLTPSQAVLIIESTILQSSTI